MELRQCCRTLAIDGSTAEEVDPYGGGGPETVGELGEESHVDTNPEFTSEKSTNSLNTLNTVFHKGTEYTKYCMIEINKQAIRKRITKLAETNSVIPNRIGKCKVNTLSHYVYQRKTQCTYICKKHYKGTKSHSV